jgi:serine/threonine protein kinase
LHEPERPAQALAGTVLGDTYRLVAKKGEGGMGAVYEALHLRLNKKVAVKLMARELAANQEALARFHREAEITSRLGHPHLVTVVDFGTAPSGEPYMVMDYLEGEDLEHRIKRADFLDIETTVQITRQTASALGAAHAKDVVHRDLKPANIFLMQVPGEADFVKVLDFGISKVKAARARLTRATAVIGTPNYMSPEQAAGRVDETDHRADQWALACIVWEMLSGRPPFSAEDISPLFYQIINLDPKPLCDQAPDAPPAVEPVLRRALSKRPEDRFPTVRDFSRAFEEAAMGRAADRTPTPVALPDPWAVRTSGGVRMRPGLSEGGLVLDGATELDAPKKVTTFSHTTGELTPPPPRRKLRPGHVFALATSVAGLAGGLVLLGARSVPTHLVPRPTTTALVAPAPLPPPPPVAPSPVAAFEAPQASRVQVAKSKPAGGMGKSARPGAVGKRKGLKTQSNRRIFEDL